VDEREAVAATIRAGRGRRPAGGGGGGGSWRAARRAQNCHRGGRRRDHRHPATGKRGEGGLVVLCMQGSAWRLGEGIDWLEGVTWGVLTSF
jgi:hypothetical protein